MDVVSLGFRTDLMLRTLQGSTVEARDGYLVVRTPANPTFHWGNFLLLSSPGPASSWVEAFAREFPDAEHIALGIDGTAGELGDAEGWTAAGLTIELDTVMTAAEVTPPPHPNTDADFRMLDSDEDWDAAVELKAAVNTEHEPVGHRVFARRLLTAMRDLQERGAGGWFGAFADGHMVSGLGVFTDGSGVARFQSVDTHPEHRRQGLAGTLVYKASRYALDQLGVRTLVMVADPGYSAIRVYRSLGFTDSEAQVHLIRRP